MYDELLIEINNEDFKLAYIHAERTLATNPTVKPEHNFYDLLRMKVNLQMEYLNKTNRYEKYTQNKDLAEQIAQGCYDFARRTTKQAKYTLDKLYGKFPMILVSNFYGNIKTVLHDFGLTKYFANIVESATVGVRKPDPKIWMLGAKAADVDPKNCLVVGDSYDKDIAPGKLAGCQTLWLENKGWNNVTNREMADQIIKSFQDVCVLLDF
jgi:putative hydrolase of the HAD superfamily